MSSVRENKKKTAIIMITVEYKYLIMDNYRLLARYNTMMFISYISIKKHDLSRMINGIHPLKLAG